MNDRLAAALTREIVQIKNALNQLVKRAGIYQGPEGRNREQKASTGNSMIRLPVEVTEYYASEQADRPVANIRGNIRLGLEIIGVLAAIALAVITLCTLRTFNDQLSEMRKQTNTAQQTFQKTYTQAELNFRRQNRPFIQIINAVTFVEQNRTAGSWTLEGMVKNYGITPARRVVADGHIIASKVNWNVRICTSQDKSLDANYGPTVAVFPGSTAQVPITVQPVTNYPAENYLAVCISYQDIEGGFSFTYGPPISTTRTATYNTEHLYSVSGGPSKPIFALVDTSVETARPGE